MSPCERRFAENSSFVNIQKPIIRGIPQKYFLSNFSTRSATCEKVSAHTTTMHAEKSTMLNMLLNALLSPEVCTNMESTLRKVAEEKSTHIPSAGFSGDLNAFLMYKTTAAQNKSSPAITEISTNFGSLFRTLKNWKNYIIFNALCQFIALGLYGNGLFYNPFEYGRGHCDYGGDECRVDSEGHKARRIVVFRVEYRNIERRHHD